MYDPFAPPPAPGQMAITSAPAVTNVAPVPVASGAPADPFGGVAPSNAIAQLYPNAQPTSMPGVQAGGWRGRQDWRGHFGGDWMKARQDWRSMIRDWRQDRPRFGQDGLQGFQDWRAQRPDFQTFMQNYGQAATMPAQGIAVGEPAPLPVVPPATPVG